MNGVEYYTHNSKQLLTTGSAVRVRSGRHFRTWLQVGDENAVGSNVCISDLTIWYSGDIGTSNNGGIHFDMGAHNGVYNIVCTIESSDPVAVALLSGTCEEGGYSMPGYMESWSCP